MIILSGLNSVLNNIIKNKEIELEYQKLVISFEYLIKRVDNFKNSKVENGFRKIFEKNGKIKVIGEIKRASPSKGIINADINILEFVNRYYQNGFFAVSVLTEKKYFLGKSEDIPYIKSYFDMPILRKDFIIDEYQIYEAFLLGADAILLITKILDEGRLKEFINIANSLNLVPLVEIENELELDRAIDCGAKLIGINNRDLSDLSINIAKTEKIIKLIPKELAVISESGIKSLKDFEYIKNLGVDGVLIGTSFVQNPSLIEQIGGVCS